MKYRFAWTYPIVFSPHDSSVLYAGGNHVFRTSNEGMSWEEISPDLSLNDKSRQGASGGHDHPRERWGGGPCDMRLCRRVAASQRRNLGVNR